MLEWRTDHYPPGYWARAWRGCRERPDPSRALAGGRPLLTARIPPAHASRRACPRGHCGDHEGLARRCALMPTYSRHIRIEDAFLLRFWFWAPIFLASELKRLCGSWAPLFLASELNSFVSHLGKEALLCLMGAFVSHLWKKAFAPHGRLCFVHHQK